METIIKKALVEDKPILKRLLELYVYDFSEFTGHDLDENGEYDYNKLDKYWTEKDHYPFLIKTGNKISGFAFVRSDEEEIYSIAEFFILKKYRHNSIGKQVAFHLFNTFKGQWQVSVLNSNKPALMFWQKIIREYSQNRHETIEKAGWDGPVYNFESVIIATGQ